MGHNQALRVGQFSMQILGQFWMQINISLSNLKNIQQAFQDLVKNLAFKELQAKREGLEP